jgi:hypothetical protein
MDGWVKYIQGKEVESHLKYNPSLSIDRGWKAALTADSMVKP